ncbi:MAG: hypothetical protein ACSHW7_03310 [Patiriisocius sp.]|uniref:hypothetical protein n=1 Tax=Patiriisocius sp. TaxID=2822396 RepID=UPI003EF22992
MDIIFYGSSHSYTCYNPLIIGNKTETIAYNLGSDALLIGYTDLILEESLKKTKPQLIVLEVYKGIITVPKKSDDIKGFQLRALDLVSNYSLKKYEKILQVYEPYEIPGVLFPLVRNHEEWNKKKYFKFSSREEFKKPDFYYGGYVGYGRTIHQYRDTYKGFRNKKIFKDETKPQLNDYVVQSIKNFVEIANKNNIPVLAVTSPDIRTPYNNYFLFDEFRALFNSLGVDYLNLNDFYEELELTIDDFRDTSHVNKFGGTKSSEFLANYINQNYSLRKRKNNKEFVEINNKYEIFKNEFVGSEQANNKNYISNVNKQFVDGIYLDSINIKKSEDFYDITLFTNKKPDDDNKYNYSFKIYSKNKNLKAENIDGHFKTKNNKIEISHPSEISEIERIEIFLYDRKGYNGIKGQKIIISNINFEE